MDKKVELAEQMLAEYEQVEAKMSSPEVLKSPAKMKAVGRRYAELGRIVRVYRDYKSAGADLEEAKEIVAAGGEDAELFKPELPGLRKSF
ncbi:MAG: PCRF domain-containing protein, partial [Ancrocorticia sp.]|nr:PCRF domain-containing protein [Ancrocorticia sp.]